jgi:hypothetical protein
LRFAVASVRRVYAGQHDHLGDLLVLLQVFGGELDLFEVHFPLGDVVRLQQLFFPVLQVDPRPEVLLSCGGPQLEDLGEPASPRRKARTL